MHTAYKGNYLQEMIKNVTAPREHFIYAGHLSTRNRDKRKKIPIQSDRIPECEYWKRMHKSQYVMSPDGDRPECHRHYEAIGMGTVPITSLDPVMHRHLEGSVVFDEFTWNLTKLEGVLPRNPVVNRRMVFEEFWIEYIERVVGHPVRWWDRSRGVRCSLTEIAAIARQPLRF
jgi:hypothetical protein